MLWWNPSCISWCAEILRPLEEIKKSAFLTPRMLRCWSLDGQHASKKCSVLDNLCACCGPSTLGSLQSFPCSICQFGAPRGAHLCEDANQHSSLSRLRSALVVKVYRQVLHFQDPRQTKTLENAWLSAGDTHVKSHPALCSSIVVSVDTNKECSNGTGGSWSSSPVELTDSLKLHFDNNECKLMTHSINSEHTSNKTNSQHITRKEREHFVHQNDIS